jgi:HPt (histidine-containing phosphotransfer) domain-containing protein
MSDAAFLSMAKAIAYLGDATSAKQLLGTLQSTLASELPHIAAAIASQDFASLQKNWHQLKGFSPVFCQDHLISEIIHTESLCKHLDSLELQEAALHASTNLLTNLNHLLSEVNAQLTP